MPTTSLQGKVHRAIHLLPEEDMARDALERAHGRVPPHRMPCHASEIGAIEHDATGCFRRLVVRAIVIAFVVRLLLLARRRSTRGTWGTRRGTWGTRRSCCSPRWREGRLISSQVYWSNPGVLAIGFLGSPRMGILATGRGDHPKRISAGYRHLARMTAATRVATAASNIHRRRGPRWVRR